MRTRLVGRTGDNFPAIGLGTWSTFDTDDDCRWLVDEALAAGVNLFDSSPMYGRAEATLAKALGPRRDDAIVATKVSAPNAETGETQIRDALRMFGRVELLQIHNIVGWRTHLPRLVALKQEGAIGLLGVSQGLLVSDAEFEEVMRTGAIDAVQIRYNPGRCSAEDRLLPLAEDLGLGVIVMQPLRWGVMLASPAPEELQELQVLDWGAAILRWILSDPRVTTVLTGTARAGRIGLNAAVADMPPYSSGQKRLVEAVIARGHTGAGGRTALGDRNPDDVLVAFLKQRLGASFCDKCLSQALAVPPDIVSEARGRLRADEFATESGPCLTCGNTGRVVRSRTIMR